MPRMADGAIFMGGCLCGNLRYAVREKIDAGYCHCRICQRSSGAPVLAWATFPIAGFAYTKGEPGVYRSSPTGVREFCATCGTQIAFRGASTPTRLDINLASLDEPGSISPEYHIWGESRIPWFEIADDLPRYPDEGPDAPQA